MSFNISLVTITCGQTCSLECVRDLAVQLVGQQPGGAGEAPVPSDAAAGRDAAGISRVRQVRVDFSTERGCPRGMDHLPEGRKGAPWSTLEEIAAAQQSYFEFLSDPLAK